MDWSQVHLRCDYCGKEIGQLNTFDTYRRAYRERKLQGKRGYFCNKECYEKYAKQFEITYKDKIMYKISDNEYVTNVGAMYYFKTAEDCYQHMMHLELHPMILRPKYL